MNRNVFLLSLLTLVWLLLGLFFHKVPCPCGDVESTASASVPVSPPEVEQPPEVDVGPLVFNWMSDTPITNNDFDGYVKDAILGKLQDGNLLEVIGHYFSNEENTSTFENMGLARAHQIKLLLAPYLDTTMVRLRSRLMGEPDDARTKPFVSASFGSRPLEQTGARVEEIGDRAIVYFPSGSMDRIEDQGVDAYLEKLANNLKASSQTVTLTGHTDNDAQSDLNLRLGMGRANAIKTILVSKGVPADRIETISKGETEPTASNLTDEGKALNRRVEIVVND